MSALPPSKTHGGRAFSVSTESHHFKNYDFWRMPPRVQTSLGADSNVAGSRFGCRREQIRMSLGADSDVAGGRFGCRSSQMRVCLVLDALRGIGNETAARVQQFSAYALRGRSKTYCFRTPS